MEHRGRLGATDHIADKVTLGVRPEHLADAGYTDVPADATVLPMQVRVVEVLGDHQYLYLQHSDNQVMTMS